MIEYSPLLANEGRRRYNRQSSTYSHTRTTTISCKGVAYLVGRVLTYLLQLRGFCLDVLHSRFLPWTKPLSTSLLFETLTDLGRSKSQPIAENALLRQQLIILRANHSEVHEICLHTPIWRAEMGDLSAQLCDRYLGLRFLRGG